MVKKTQRELKGTDEREERRMITRDEYLKHGWSFEWVELEPAPHHTDAEYEQMVAELAIEKMERDELKAKLDATYELLSVASDEVIKANVELVQLKKDAPILRPDQITITMAVDEWETVLKALNLATLYITNRTEFNEDENPFAIYDFIRDEIPRKDREKKEK